MKYKMKAVIKLIHSLRLTNRNTKHTNAVTVSFTMLIICRNANALFVLFAKIYFLKEKSNHLKFVKFVIKRLTLFLILMIVYNSKRLKNNYLNLNTLYSNYLKIQKKKMMNIKKEFRKYKID